MITSLTGGGSRVGAAPPGGGARSAWDQGPMSSLIAAAAISTWTTRSKLR